VPANRRLGHANDHSGSAGRRINLVESVELAFAQNVVEKLVQQVGLSAVVCCVPILHHDVLNAPHGLFPGDTGIGYAIQGDGREVGFLLR
jgi:hypothetical protein